MSARRATAQPVADVAARQAGFLFLLSGLLALAGIPTAPDRAGVLLLIAVADLLVAIAGFALPWGRWQVSTAAWLALPGWVILGLSTWAFGGFATGTGPFFVLLFAWLGLHQSRRTVLANAPLATIAYAGALIAEDASPQLLGTTVVLIPVGVAVGLIISSRVQRLNEAREVIEREERWRTALMATLAHDVRTPLTTIKGVLEIVAEDEGTPDRVQSLVAAATRQTERISLLANNLLDLERVGAGRLRLDLEDVPLRDLATYVQGLFDDLEIEVDVDPSVVVWADRLRLEQMLVNLTTNALRHGRPPVVISALSVQGGTFVSVRDHGPGVPVEDQPLLFERLTPSDRTAGSVGLGLWIVRILAQAHGGSVGYRTLEPGADFSIVLPDNRQDVLGGGRGLLTASDAAAPDDPAGHAPAPDRGARPAR